MQTRHSSHWALSALVFAAITALGVYAYYTFGKAAATPVQDLLDTATRGVVDVGRPHYELRLIQGGRM